ncbi:hypothetical protein DPMN_103780 [Dreissena polymorpha]|uniref:Peptidase M12B domain-containing protein n=2 Tax=Dreissena polymorpha TaxID=45954 RepID=A0A9D4H6K5_DREPO|nr:hypothetical protein DPMN_103780 [Dreissena polymorpha]
MTISSCLIGPIVMIGLLLTLELAPLAGGSLVNAIERNGTLRRHNPVGPEMGAALDENIFLDMEIDGIPHGSKPLIRQHFDLSLNDTQPVGRRVANSAIYTSEDRDIIYRVDVELDGTTSTYGLVRHGGALDFFNGRGKVLELQFNNEAVSPSTPSTPEPDFLKLTENLRTKRQQHRQRAIVDDIETAVVPKVVVFVDTVVVNKFLPLNNNQMAKTRADISKFFTLVANELTIMYQTLRQYNNLLYRGATALPQNIAVQIVNVVFPPGNTDYSFVTDNLNQGVLTDFATLTSFRVFLDTYISPVPYDHATLITGFDLRSSTGANRLGIAYTYSMCWQLAFDLGYHSSINEFTADVMETMAHELGHGLGMQHDGLQNSCEDLKFLMVGSGDISASTSTVPTYRTFSQCSSEELEIFTDLILPEDEFRPTCLLPPTASFIMDFCKGLSGKILTLDEQCQLVFGATSSRCSLLDVQGAVTEDHLAHGYVVDCHINEITNQQPFFCFVPNSAQCKPIPDVSMGTKCVIDGVRNPNNICSQGLCERKPLCED